MQISLIVAVADNEVIGRKGSVLPWHLGAELQRFKKITMGHAIIMGRATHETIGRALPGRHNIVISRNSGYQAEGCTVVDSVEAALRVAGEIDKDRAAVIVETDGAISKIRKTGMANETDGATNEVFVIGGADIFVQTLPRADKIYLTRVHASPVGDTFFRYNSANWVEGAAEFHPADDRDDFAYTFAILTRKPK
jgi:dihydrofolate reductase